VFRVAQSASVSPRFRRPASELLIARLPAGGRRHATIKLGIYNKVLWRRSMLMHTIWHDMFALGIPVAQKILRPLVVYLFLVLALRLAGKHELAQLNPFDLVLLLSLSNSVLNAIIG